METIPKAECEKIGFLRKTHGVHGEMVLEFEECFEFSVEEAERFFVELEGLLVPFFIEEEGLRFRSAKSANVKFDGVKTEQYAKRLIGKDVYLYKSEIVDTPVEEDASLTGFSLYDRQLGEIGTIEEVNDYSGNLVLSVSYKDKELLIPYNEEFVVDFDEIQKKVTLAIPDGLIES